jgi:hypothetical protein
MVDALREARRVLARSGLLIDLRPVTVPIVTDVVIGTRSVWSKTVASYSAPEDVAAADRAVQHAISSRWLTFETSVPFDFDIYCDTPSELRTYVAERKLRGTEIPYAELEQQQRAFGPQAQAARLRCRRRWMLSTYRKR